MVVRHRLGEVFDRVFDGMPVAFLDIPDGHRSSEQHLQRAWAESFTPESLAVSVQEAHERATANWRERLTTDYWWNKIERVAE